MSTLEINLTQDVETPFFSQTVTLDGRDYALDFAWNDRGQYWALAVITNDGETIVAGQLMAIGKDLCARSVSANKPPGLLVALPKTASVELPLISDLTERVGLYYFGVT